MAPAFRLMTRRIPQHIPLATSIPRQSTQRRLASTVIAQHKTISALTVSKLHALNPKVTRTLSQSNAFTHVARFQQEPEFKVVSHRAIQQWRFLHCSSARHTSPKSTQDEQPASTPERQKPSQTQTLNSASPSTASKTLPTFLTKLTPSSTTTTHENIYTLPNFLTSTRILTAPIISYCLLHSQPFLAMTLFAYSSITDLIDGYLARRYNSGTVLGSILDPFADKLLMTLTTITLYSIGTFPWWLTLTILGRDAGLLLSALYFRWISLPPPRTMARYWDFSLPSAEVRPTEISKINTLLQFLLVADALLLPTLPVAWVEAWNLWGVFEGWMGLVAATTVWSGASYLFTKDAIRFIGKEK